MSTEQPRWLDEIALAGPHIFDAKQAPDDGVHVRMTACEVSIFPPDDLDGRNFVVTIEWRGKDKWGVYFHGRCLGTDGKWDWESIPSEREDEWLATHRFDCSTALQLAREWAPKVNVNGHVAAEVAARRAQEQPCA